MPMSVDLSSASAAEFHRSKALGAVIDSSPLAEWIQALPNDPVLNAAHEVQRARLDARRLFFPDVLTIADPC